MESNMVNVIDKIAMDINRWIKIPSSWWPKIKVIKINVTLKQIYILRDISMLINF